MTIKLSLLEVNKIIYLYSPTCTHKFAQYHPNANVYVRPFYEAYIGIHISMFYFESLQESLLRIYELIPFLKFVIQKAIMVLLTRALSLLTI